MADEIDKLLASIEAGQAANDTPLSTPEKVLGYSRSYLAGPLFNFEDELEAAMVTALNDPIKAVTSPAQLFATPDYQNELNSIRSQQQRFKDKTDYLDNVVEIGSGIILNPLDKLGKLYSGAKYGATTLSRILSNPITQSAIAGAGAADGEDIFKSAGKGALFGTAGSAAGALVGSAARKAGREADRLKLSAFGITQADLNRQIKKLGDAAPESADNLPILKTLEKAEGQKIVNVDNDVLTNMAGVLDEQDKIAVQIHTFLSGINDSVAVNPLFDAPNTMRFINGLSGTARQKALDKFIKEYTAIADQLGSGSLLDLQKAKVGLNYAWEKDAMGENIIKTLREDLKEAIEKRIDQAVRDNKLSRDSFGKIKSLNREWGDYAELKDAFARRAARDLGGDVIDDIFRSARTTEGMGTANIASAITGDPLYAAAGATLNMARASAGKNMLADTLREFQTPLKKVGGVLLGETGPAPITGRSSVQAAEALGLMNGDQRSNDARTIDKLLSVIESAQGGKQNSVLPGANGQILDDSYVLQSNLQDRESAARPAARSSISDYSIIPSAYAESSDDVLSDYSPYETVTQRLFGGTEAMKGDVDMDSLVRAVIGQESRGKSDAISPKGATGLMQVMPATAREIANELGYDTYDLKDPETNREFGTHYLKKMMKMFGDPELALAAYNAGPGRVKGWIEKYGTSDWNEIAARLKRAGRYSETVKYVPQVLARLGDVIEV